MKKLVILLSLFISTTLFAQKFTLEGIVKDESAHVLEGATVYLQSIKDSIPIAYGITNKNGEFYLQVNTENEPKAIFNIAYMGYKPYKQDIDVPTGKQLNMGSITLDDQAEELNVVSIIAKAPPILIKRDTIEYNADSFKTMPNDKVEDLLKKLPGVEIDLDGIITVNGVEVEAINVDGMRFFGEKNGAIALKNIPSNAISKVQVTDFKTDMQKFTGEESDSGTKEINLKIKKGQNKAYFGDVNLGYGTDEKYQANANLFQLIDGKQLGVIMGTNNINMSRGFNSLPDADSSNGYIESDFLGANFSKGKWNETRVNADYKYSNQSNDRAQKSYTENFLPDLNYITNSESRGFNDSDRHDVGSDLKFLIEPKNKTSRNNVQLSNKTNFNTSNTDSFSTSTKKSEYANGDLVSTYFSKNESNTRNYNFGNTFEVTSRIGDKRDYFNIGITTDFDSQDGQGSNYSKNDLESSNTSVVQDQISNSNNSGAKINLNARWNKELFTNFRLTPRYTATVNSQKDEKSIYDYNENTEKYDDFNDQISVNSRYVNTTIRPSLGVRYDYKEFRFELEGSYTSAFRNYEDNIIEARNFKNEFDYVTYSGSVRYRDEKGYKNVRLDYDQNVNLPSISQLQPIADVSNITSIRTGNPFLKPAVSHEVGLRYQNNIAYNNINVTANAKAEFVQDKIINSTITDSDLIRYTTYENINGDYSISGNTAISKSYFSKKTNFNINLRLKGDYDNIRSIQNTLKFTTKTYTLKPSLSFSYSYDKKIDISTSYSYALTNTKYDTNTYNDNEYFVQNLRLESSVFFLKDAFFTNKVSYRYNSRVGDDFDGAAVFWNAGLGVQLWDNKATLTAVGYDILGKNNGYSRSISETSIQDVENKILEQYFMLTFVYKFGRFAGQKMNLSGGNSRRGSGRR
ncbi:outer membrane beta-barrel protein [Mariniflexile litorale]|uniref:Outer membrane beta-barrel protein n=1 Tax=Mariniflexile litorale TaxID=3045158 RepID=A0AAU7EGY0_9FLAO|nr:outer membrane beta-barrel protein [Mariniflexile sp. KMM 9835]MDQ8211702.1 outer membrane beta-barrel protein [Mariniflexile sp. KMM 9835]